jgi:hypothetical protein
MIVLLLFLVSCGVHFPDAIKVLEMSPFTIGKKRSEYFGYHGLPVIGSLSLSKN